jgi:hypothetical protein
VYLLEKDILSVSVFCCLWMKSGKVISFVLCAEKHIVRKVCGKNLFSSFFYEKVLLNIFVYGGV